MGKKQVTNYLTCRNLPELPMYSIALITDEQKENDARDVFISYLEAALDNLK